LGLYINDTLTWKTHIDNIWPKLCSACFAMRSVKPYVSQQMLKAIYYSYFHSIMSYGIIFWGQSANSIRVFRLQKRILRILMGCKNRDSCRKLFINLKILPLPSQYIFCLLLFVVKNRELFSTNNEIHPFCTRQHQNLHQPSANLTKYQTGVVPLLKKFLCENSFFLWKNFTVSSNLGSNSYISVCSAHCICIDLRVLKRYHCNFIDCFYTHLL
jgi:hypothetical protein